MSLPLIWALYGLSMFGIGLAIGSVAQLYRLLPPQQDRADDAETEAELKRLQTGYTGQNQQELAGGDPQSHGERTIHLP